MKIRDIKVSAFLQNLAKAYTEGIYADTPANRKLGRVGMTYAQYTQKVAGGEDKSGEQKEQKNIKNKIDFSKEKFLSIKGVSEEEAAEIRKTIFNLCKKYISPLSDENEGKNISDKDLINIIDNVDGFYLENEGGELNLDPGGMGWNLSAQGQGWEFRQAENLSSDIDSAIHNIHEKYKLQKENNDKKEENSLNIKNKINELIEGIAKSRFSQIFKDKKIFSINDDGIIKIIETPSEYINNYISENQDNEKIRKKYIDISDSRISKDYNIKSNLDDFCALLNGLNINDVEKFGLLTKSPEEIEFAIEKAERKLSHDAFEEDHALERKIREDYKDIIEKYSSIFENLRKKEGLGGGTIGRIQASRKDNKEYEIYFHVGNESKIIPVDPKYKRTIEGNLNNLSSSMKTKKIVINMLNNEKQQNPFKS